jgi:uncharacterized protein (DUF486 family)
LSAIAGSPSERDGKGASVAAWRGYYDAAREKVFSFAARAVRYFQANVNRADAMIRFRRPFSENERHAMPALPPSSVPPILLLLASNVFMTTAWYGHLKYKSSPLWLAIVASWAIAFVEYCLAVPANRWGSAVYSTAQLKTIQEVITLIVFAGFSVLVLKEPLTLNHAVGFALIAAGAYFIFKGPF